MTDQNNDQEKLTEDTPEPEPNGVSGDLVDNP